jgi:hypothetical protein
LLSQNILLDNYNTIYLVNNKDLINSGTFIKAKITSFLIIKYSIHIIKNIVNKPIGLYIKDLIFYNIIVIKGFYINIISEAYLVEKKA